MPAWLCQLVNQCQELTELNLSTIKGDYSDKSDGSDSSSDDEYYYDKPKKDKAFAFACKNMPPKLRKLIGLNTKQRKSQTKKDLETLVQRCPELESVEDVTRNMNIGDYVDNDYSGGKVSPWAKKRSALAANPYGTYGYGHDIYSVEGERSGIWEIPCKRMRLGPIKRLTKRLAYNCDSDSSDYSDESDD